MLKDVEKIELVGKVIFKDGKAYSEIKELGRVSEIDGCSKLKELIQKRKEWKTKKEALLKEIAERDMEDLADEKLELELRLNGYCPIDFLVTNPLSSAFNKHIHRQECKHKE